MSAKLKDVAAVSETQVELIKDLVKQDLSAANSFPLSFTQQRLWFLDELEPGLPIYNIPSAIRLSGVLDPGALARSLNEVVKRHEILRTIFISIEGRPRQVVLPELTLDLPVIELKGFNRTKQEERVAELRDIEARRPFNLSHGPLLRANLLQLDQHQHILLLTLHHIVSDGWSTGLLVRELGSLYQSFTEGKSASLPALEIQYADFAVWQSEWAESEEYQEQLDYWHEKLQDAAPVLNLPTDHPRPAVKSYRGAIRSFELDSELTQKLQELSKHEGATLFMTLLATFQVLLHRYTRQDDILVGTPIANRNPIETEQLIGFFANTLVLRTMMSDLPFHRILQLVREDCLGSYANQELPFEKLVEVLHPDRNLSSSPLFQVMFMLRNTPQTELNLPDLSLEMIEAHSATAKFDLTLSIAETEQKLQGHFEYSTELFEPETISRMIDHYEQLLRAVVANPYTRISQLRLLTPAEERQLIEEWVRTEREELGEVLVHELFEEQARWSPAAIAVSTETENISYEELNRRANQLSHYLRDLGVGPEVVVGVCAQRSVALVVGILGTLKAGAAYLPIDPSYPAARINYMLQDAGVAVLLTQQDLLAKFDQSLLRTLSLDNEWEEIARCSSRNLALQVSGQNLAYLIYTSGSTGQPKGVLIEHGGLSNYLVWATEFYQVNSLQQSPLHTSISFDLSITSLFPPLLNGGTVKLLSEGTELESLAGIIRSSDPALIKLTPSHLRILAAEKDGLSESGTEHVFVVGGESLSAQSLHWWSESNTPVRLINEYGPTETVVGCCVHELVAGQTNIEAIPIGRPIWNTEMYVLGQQQELLPVGVIGELYIGGSGVARGYTGRPAATAEKFIPHPFSAKRGARLYRTGDLGRYLPNGEIEYLGRVDEQVKIRGYRIELGEVEEALERHESVRESVVIVRETKSGEQQLVGYVVASAEVGVGQLRSFLAEQLPEYMVPSVIVKLEAVPLTANGKVDRKALPEPGQFASTKEYVAPRTAVEELLAVIWTAVLAGTPADQIGVHDNFFELGGHSLLATQVISRVRESFKIELPLRSLFEAPSIELLAAKVEAVLKGQPRTVAAGPEFVERRAEGMPLSFAQQRLWFIHQLDPESASYHIPGAVRLRGQLVVPVLAQSLQTIIDRHESLRTSFPSRAGQPWQEVRADVEWHLREWDLSEAAGPDQESEVAAILQSQIRLGFDLANGPLFRVVLVRLANDEHILLIVLHHIIADGWSMEILLHELTSIYEHRLRGEQAELPQLKVHYIDYALWQRDWLSGELFDEQARYWKEQLSGAPPVLELPTDMPRVVSKSLRGATQTFAFDLSLTQRVKRLSRENETTLFMTLLTAFHVLLHRYTGQTDIVVGTPIANRTRTEIEPLIGFFVNILALRSKLTGELSFKEILERVKEVCLGAYVHQDMPFERLVELLQPNRELAHAPVFQVTFALQNAPRELSRLSSLKWSTVEVETETVKFDLSLNLVDAEDGLRGAVQYNADLFTPETISRLVCHYEAVIRAAVESIHQPVGEIELLRDEERQQVLEGWNWTERKLDRTRTVVELFEEQVELHPEANAVSYEGSEITYLELNQRANQLARYLQQQGVGPEVLVGVCLERSVELVVGLLGTLKAGGAYLPLDPSYPGERLEFMLEDSGVPILLTSEKVAAILPPTNAHVVPLDSDRVIAALPSHNPIHSLDASNLAYVIYTSGSTGKPKAVLVQHESLLNLVLWHHDRFGVTSTDRATQLASLAFDAAVWELWPYLTTGGCVCLLRDVASLNGEELRDWLIQQGVTLSFMPTPLAERVLNLSWPEETTLRTLLTGGDQLRTNKDASLPFTLVNNYGPTECAVVATSGEVPAVEGPAEIPSIGRPIDNTRVYVVNEFLEPAPVGVLGELLIGGDGVARGYHHQPNMTAENFTPDPFTCREGSRLYRTGDVVRWRNNGELEFVGRKDGQVKVRGYRIELAEVEAVLEQHEAIAESVVTVREGERGERRLVGYVAFVSGRSLSLLEMREFMATKVPHYMMPTAFVTLAELPLTPNGKIDYRALPAPDIYQITSEQEFVEPANATEQIIANIFAEVLGLEKVSAGDNFFELGGHSLLATQVVSRVRETFQVELPLRALFEAPEVAALASRVSAAMIEATGAELTGPKRIERNAEGMPLSFAQQRLWFMQQWEPHSGTFNIPAAVRLSGEVNIAALEQGLQEIVNRHESLRTRFVMVAGEVRQQISDAWPLTLSVEDLQFAEGRDRLIQKLLEEEVRKSFALSQLPLLRVRLVRLAPTEHLLLLVVHHIVADGWSMGLLLQELVKLYERYAHGVESDLASLTLQYVDFAQWQNESLSGESLAEQERYWKDQLADAPPVLELPTDRVRPTVQTFSGGRESLKLSASLSERLKVVSRQTDTTPFMVLLAAFQILLSRHSGQEDIVVGTPTAGRNHRSIEPLIGMFLNTLVLRTDLSGNPTFRELLARVREVCLGAYAHQEMPFEKLLEVLQPVRNLSHSPLIQVYLNMLNLPDARIEVPGLILENLALPESGSKFDLTLYLKEQPDGLLLNLVYNSDLFEAPRMSMLLAQYEHLLGQVLENVDEHIGHFCLVAPVTSTLLPDPALPLPSHWCGGIHNAFAEQALINPDNYAVVETSGTWTYRELNERSNQLAHYLLFREVPRQGVIVVWGHRSAELIWGLLGILKAGAAFTILDPTYPDARLLEYLEAVEPKGFLQLEAAGSLSPQLQEYIANLPLHFHLLLRRPGSLTSAQVETDAVLADFSTDDPAITIAADDRAYIAFTSGSTGKPKGIIGRHQSLSLFGRWASETFNIGVSDRFSVLSGLAHDPLHRDILTPLQLGATVCIPDPDGIGRPGYLAQWFSREKITVSNLTPAMGQILSESVTEEDDLSSLRHVFYIGDVLTRQAVSTLRRIAPEMNCVNLYGATETQRAVSFFVTPQPDAGTSVTATVTAGKEILPVGRGIKEVQLLVLNNAGRLAGVGEVGEVCFRSPHLSGGYLSDEPLTREKFVINPITNLAHDRVYRSGDLGRYQPDGNVVLLGRRDSQVKIRGYRIELSEVEGALVAHPAVKDCTVLAHEYGPGDKRLIAYVVPHVDCSVTAGELRHFVGQRLPQYMVPSQNVFLSALPLTPNGKLNRRALPAPDDQAIESDSVYVAPRTPVEEKLVKIWEDLLGVPRVGVHDNFFELGGHSLLATRMISHLRDVTNVELSVRSLFESPTIAEIALLVVQLQMVQKNDHSLESLLAGLEQLSEVDLEALLN
jgi:amino acid adenylation domain-containing protein